MRLLRHCATSLILAGVLLTGAQARAESTLQAPTGRNFDPIETGTAHFQQTLIGNLPFDFFVDYAVFKPGSFSSPTYFNNALTGSHVDFNNDYIYAYQVYNTGDNTVPLTIFKVVLAQDVTASGMGYSADWAAGITPTSTTGYQILQGDAALFPFLLTPNASLLRGDTSGALWLSSPFGPGTNRGIAVDHGQQIETLLAAPVPLPSAAWMAALGLTMVGGIGVWRARKCLCSA